MSLSKQQIEDLLAKDPRARKSAAEVLSYLNAPLQHEPAHSIGLFEAEFGALPRGSSL